jgi:predicted short-subunit dehydrogenase-like oxidoreductase (DUF2520 family)
MAAAIAIIGTGRMARALGALLYRSGVPIAAVGGRNRHAAAEAAAFIGQGEPVSFLDITHYSQDVLIAVSDDAIEAISGQLSSAPIPPRAALHTSGAAGPEALGPLRKSRTAIGVLHPLQTVPSSERGIADLPGSTFGIAGDPDAVSWAEALVRQLGGTPLPLRAEGWQKYHAAAVMVSNHYVALASAALALMKGAGVEHEAALRALAPLMRTTVENIVRSGPEAALTGPIRRGDAGTIRHHLSALQTESPEMLDLYLAASRQALSLAQRAGLPPAAARELEAILSPAEFVHE